VTVLDIDMHDEENADKDHDWEDEEDEMQDDEKDAYANRVS